jgi:type II secretory pathway component PulF
MEAATLTDFMALNDQLVALAEAGVPVDVDLGRGPDAWPRDLEKINAEAARRVSRGLSLPAALEAREALGSATYRSIVRLGMESGNPTAALDISTQFAEATQCTASALRLASIYPAIVCLFVYLGLVASCLFFVPMLEEFYDSMELPAGSGLGLLRALRDALPYWVGIPPAVLVIFFVWWRASGTQSSQPGHWLITHWSPGAARAQFEQRAANFAGALATLLESGVAFPSALGIAAGMWNDCALARDLEALAANSAAGALAANSSAITRLPPFLRWALFPGETAIEPPRALRMAERLYRDSARHRLERLQTLAPIVACVVVGGCVTLLYALALLIPVVQMIRGLAI